MRMLKVIYTGEIFYINIEHYTFKEILDFNGWILINGDLYDVSEQILLGWSDCEKYIIPDINSSYDFVRFPNAFDRLGKKLFEASSQKSSYTPVKLSKTYLMYEANTGYYKIGKSKNPKRREKTLQSEQPNITLFAVFNEDIENILHDQYSECRIRGEWFKLNNDNLKEIFRKYDFKIY